MLPELQRRLCTEDIPCLPCPPKRSRAAPLCRFLYYYVDRVPLHLCAATALPPIVWDNPMDSSSLAKPANFAAPMPLGMDSDGRHHTSRKRRNDDEDSDCYSMSSLDASFEWHRSVEPKHPEMRGGTKAPHPPNTPSVLIECDSTFDDIGYMGEKDHFDTFMIYPIGSEVDF